MRKEAAMIDFLSTDKAWCFRVRYLTPTKYMQIRPYWINPPSNRSRSLTDQEIKEELSGTPFESLTDLVLKVIHEMEKTMSDEKFTLFWRGPLSQWSPSKFTVDGKEYHNAEQYMMAEKARLFGDKEMERKIMATSSPREAKDFGRKVKDFVNHEWQAVARDIVYRGNYAKFTQSKKIHKAALMETVGTTLVEASPTDKIWGIGITEEKPEAHDRKRWKGKNWLGEVITKVRDDIVAGVESTEFNWS